MNTNKQESPVILEQQLRDRLKQESDSFGNALANMQKDGEKVEQEIASNKAILKEMEFLRDGLAVEIDRLTKRITELRTDLDSLGPKLEELRQTEAKVNHLGVALDGYKKQEGELKDKILQLTETCNRRQADLDEVSHSITAKKTELANVVDEVERGKKAKREELVSVEAVLVETKNRVNGEMAAVESLKNQKESLQKEVNSLLGEVEKLKTEVEPLRAKTVAIKHEADEYKSTIEEALAIKKAESEQRDGELSIKEASLAAKEKKLKDIKAALEKQSGKAININF